MKQEEKVIETIPQAQDSPVKTDVQTQVEIKIERPQKQTIEIQQETEKDELVQDVPKAQETEKTNFNVETELNKILEEKEIKVQEPQQKEVKSLYTLFSEHFIKDIVPFKFENLNFLAKPKQKPVVIQPKINSPLGPDDLSSGVMFPSPYYYPQSPQDPQYYQFMSYLMANQMVIYFLF